MRVRKKGKNYWITGMPRYYADGRGYTECGPYETREEAKSDLEGMQRIYERIGWENEEPPKDKPRIKAKRKATIVDPHKEVTAEKPKRKPAIEDEGFW